MIKTTDTVRIVPKKIPLTEKKLLCADFLNAITYFYKDNNNQLAFEKWCMEKGENVSERKNG